MGGSLVYQDNNVEIRFLKCYRGTSYHSDYNYIEFNVTNKTNKELTFQTDAIAINGVSYGNLSGSDEVAPNSTGRITFDTYKDKLPTSGLSKMSGVINVIDFDTYKDYDAKFVDVVIK